MSIIRLSMLRDELYAPDEKGDIVEEPFSQARGVDRRGAGRMPKLRRGELPTETHPLWRYLAKSLEIEAAALPADAPILVMTHGFQFDPAMRVMSPPHHHKADNPHARIFHFETHDLETEMRHHSTGWPLRLGFADQDAGAAGLCLAFGWYSNPGFFSSLFEHGRNFYARAYQEAENAAWGFLCTLYVLAKILDRRIDVFAHSLGTRVVIRALASAVRPEPNLGSRQPVAAAIEAVDRAILLAGAEKVLEAQLMMSRLNLAREAGAVARIPSFYNVLSRENDVLDKLGENFGPAAPGSKQVIGHNGLEWLDPNWLDLQLDDPDVAAWAKRVHGLRISGDNSSSIFAVLDHWIHFTWPDNMKLYAGVLRDRGAWDAPMLKSAEPALFNTRRLLRGPGAVGFD